MKLVRERWTGKHDLVKKKHQSPQNHWREYRKTRPRKIRKELRMGKTALPILSSMLFCFLSQQRYRVHLFLLPPLLFSCVSAVPASFSSVASVNYPLSLSQTKCIRKRGWLSSAFQSSYLHIALSHSVLLDEKFLSLFSAKVTSGALLQCK